MLHLKCYKVISLHVYTQNPSALCSTTSSHQHFMILLLDFNPATVWLQNIWKHLCVLLQKRSNIMYISIYVSWPLVCLLLFPACFSVLKRLCFSSTCELRTSTQRLHQYQSLDPALQAAAEFLLKGKNGFYSSNFSDCLHSAAVSLLWSSRQVCNTESVHNNRQ